MAGTGRGRGAVPKKLTLMMDSTVVVRYGYEAGRGGQWSGWRSWWRA